MSKKIAQVVSEIHALNLDPVTLAHVERVAELARLYADQAGFSPERREHLTAGAWAHDVGKFHISYDILLKPGRLTELERKVMETHTVLGAADCRESLYLAPYADMAWHHHEKDNGSGYPDGLTAEQIHEDTKIMAVLDVYEALTSPYRSYKEPWTHDEAKAELMKEVGKGRHQETIVGTLLEAVEKDRDRFDLMKMPQLPDRDASMNLEHRLSEIGAYQEAFARWSQNAPDVVQFGSKGNNGVHERGELVALVTPDMGGDTNHPWRITFFSRQGTEYVSSGHSVYASKQEALKDAQRGKDLFLGDELGQEGKAGRYRLLDDVRRHFYLSEEHGDACLIRAKYRSGHEEPFAEGVPENTTPEEHCIKRNTQETEFVEFCKRNDRGENLALYRAANFGFSYPLTRLLEAGVDSNVPDKAGRFPLLAAAASGNSENVKKLLEHGAAVNTQDFTGKTPLMAAAEKGNAETIGILLDAGADRGISDMKKNTALDLARAGGHVDTIERLEHAPRDRSRGGVRPESTLPPPQRGRSEDRGR